MILQDDFDVVTVCDIQDVCILGELRRVLWWIILYQIILENLISDAEILSQLDRGFWIGMRNAVESIPEFSPNLPGGVCQLDGAGDVDATVVVRSLWIRPGSASSEIPTVRSELIE